MSIGDSRKVVDTMADIVYATDVDLVENKVSIMKTSNREYLLEAMAYVAKKSDNPDFIDWAKAPNTEGAKALIAKYDIEFKKQKEKDEKDEKEINYIRQAEYTALGGFYYSKFKKFQDESLALANFAKAIAFRIGK